MMQGHKTTYRAGLRGGMKRRMAGRVRVKGSGTTAENESEISVPWKLVMGYEVLFSSLAR